MTTGNIPERNPFEWWANNHLVNISIVFNLENDIWNKWYTKIRSFWWKQERKAILREGITFAILLVLISELIIYYKNR